MLTKYLKSIVCNFYCSSLPLFCTRESLCAHPHKQKWGRTQDERARARARVRVISWNQTEKEMRGRVRATGRHTYAHTHTHPHTSTNTRTHEEEGVTRWFGAGGSRRKTVLAAAFWRCSTIYAHEPCHTYRWFASQIGVQHADVSATYCNITLQHTTMYCNTLQYLATHWRIVCLTWRIRCSNCIK